MTAPLPNQSEPEQADPSLPEVFPPGPAAERIQGPAPAPVAVGAKSPARTLKRVWVLIAGTSVIVFGVIIAPLPGPGPTVLVPVGLGILASEFMWAKRLINQLSGHAGPLERFADRTAMHMPIWMAPLIGVAYWGLVTGIAMTGWVKTQWLMPPAGLLFAPIGFWCWRIYVLRRKNRPAQPRA